MLTKYLLHVSEICSQIEKMFSTLNLLIKECDLAHMKYELLVTFQIVLTIYMQRK